MSRTISIAAICSALLAMTAQQGQAASISIDFDNLPGGGTLAPGTVLTDQYAGLGITFSAFEDGSLVDSAVVDSFIGPAFPPYHAANYWGNTPDNAFSQRHDALRMTFAEPVSGVTWYTQPHSLVWSVTFEARDIDGVLLETVVATSPLGPPTSWVLTSFTAGNISRIDGFQQTDDHAWGLDNLSFVTGTGPVVPEPSTLTLLGIGLTGLCSRRWRRQRTPGSSPSRRISCRADRNVRLEEPGHQS